MRNKLRKNYQRKLNKIIKNINKNIENDELWNGRFIFFQHSAEFEIFPDKSGGFPIFCVQLCSYPQIHKVIHRFSRFYVDNSVEMWITIRITVFCQCGRT